MEKLGNKEKEVLKFVCLGYTNKEIGKFLNISHHTVKGYIINILRALDARDRSNAAYITGKTGIQLE